ncbi:MAG: AAA family ATPase [Chloroflexota bacterium]
MYIDKIRIRGYKAIDDVTIRLNKPLIPIVGLNEAGKSLLLEALLACMYYNDGIGSGAHLNPHNIYTGDSHAELDMILQFDSRDEIVQWRNSLRQSDKAAGNKLDSYLQTYNQRSIPIILRRYLPDGEYRLLYINGGNEVVVSKGTYSGYTAVGRFIDTLPYFAYFEDFIDRIPPTITFNRDDSGRFTDNTNPTNAESSVWHRILFEIFERSSIDFKQYLTAVESDDYVSDPFPVHPEKLEIVQSSLNEKLASEWFALTGDALDTLFHQIKIHHRLNRNVEEGNIVGYEHIFFIRIKDDRNESQPSAFGISQRSKGYQWFCNFVLKLFYNHHYHNKRKNALFLLDEPGAYLHADAQDRLLDRLKELSQFNRVIYTTHLPALVNPNKIPLKHCLIAQRESYSVTLTSYGNVHTDEMREAKALGAVGAIFKAMKQNLPALMFPSAPKPFVITEGIGDFYVFRMVQSHTTLFDGLDMDFIPAEGVSNLGSLISLAIAWSDPYSVIFDKDDAGNKAITRYAKAYGEEQKRFWVQLDNVAKDKTVALERLFSDEDQHRLLDITEATDLKKAYPLLYFGDDSNKVTFWDDISDETRENFTLLADKLRNILSPIDDEGLH